MKGSAVKGYRGMGMNGPIAKWYTTIREKDSEEWRNSARRVSLFLDHFAKVLEIAPGPGFMAIELARLGDCEVTGIDISGSFVRIASEKAAKSGVRVDFRQGDAADLPFADDTFDLTYCVAAFKNFSRPLEAMAEMRRVIKLGGTALIYDLRPDVSDETIARHVRGMGLSRLNALLTGLIFRHTLAKRAHPKEKLREMAAVAAFKSCEVREEPMGFEVILKK
jgi:ubiquinone/menaquinone biosynthesis C-methylase UbiE